MSVVGGAACPWTEFIPFPTVRSRAYPQALSQRGNSSPLFQGANPPGPPLKKEGKRGLPGLRTTLGVLPLLGHGGGDLLFERQ